MLYWSKYFRCIKNSFILFFLGGANPAVLRSYSRLCTLISLLVCLREHMGCHELNPGQLHAKQELFLLYYC